MTLKFGLWVYKMSRSRVVKRSLGGAGDTPFLPSFLDVQNGELLSLGEMAPSVWPTHH